MNISEFNHGDEIVRVEPTPTQESQGLFGSHAIGGDTSYIGEKLVLSDVCNGLIYLATTKEDKFLEKPIGATITLTHHTFGEGWEKWREPIVAILNGDQKNEQSN